MSVLASVVTRRRKSGISRKIHLIRTIGTKYYRVKRTMAARLCSVAQWQLRWVPSTNDTASVQVELF